MKNSSFTLNYCNSLKSLTQIVWTVNIGKMAIPDVNLRELNIKSSMILHLTSTIEITSYRDLEEKMKHSRRFL